MFVTTHAEETTIWVMVEEGERRLRYARVTAGDTAGTVTINVVDAAPTRTRLRVEYDLTALGSRGAERLATFRENFANYIGEWEAAIATTSPPAGDPPGLLRAVRQLSRITPGGSGLRDGGGPRPWLA